MFSHAIKHINDSGTGGKPYDAEVEYIESSGTQRIDIPSITIDSTTSIELAIEATTYSGDVKLFGYHTVFVVAEISGAYRLQHSNNWTVTDVNVSQHPSIIVRANSQNTTIEENGTIIYTKASGLPSGTFYPTIGGLRDGTSYLYGSGRYKYLRIFQNGVKVVDIIPVRVGTEFCMYDRANPTGGDNGDGLYHNKGTGAFLGGIDKPSAGTKFLVSRTMGTSLGKIKPVLKHYDIATSYLINECTGARPTKTNAVFPSGKYAALDYTPIAYQHYDAEVEYLECSGTQWVDTQWYPGKDAAYGSCYYQIDFMQPSTFTGSPEMEVWGCWGGGANWNCWANGSGSSLTVVSGSRAANTRVVMGKALSGTSSKPIGLFAWQGLAHPCNGVRIYSYQVRRSSATGVLLQDFIPVRVGTAGYFYDRVSGKLFGTGNLAVGPDTGGGKGAKRFIGWGTAPYYDSEVNYVECTGTQYLDTGLYIDPTKQHIKSTCRIQFIGTGRQLMGWNVNDNCYWGVANGGTNYEVGGTTTTTTSTTMPKTGGVDTLVWEHFTNANQTLTLKGSTDTVISRAKAAGLPGEYYILQLAGSFIGKMYGYTIEIDDQLVRDYVPVRCGTIGMLYDRITNQLWASSSTDPFIPGTDVSASTVLPTNRSLTPSDNLIYDIPMVHAQWQSPTTVTFDATTNGGQMPSGWDAPDYYEGQPYGTLPTPTHATLNFIGWYLNGSKVIATDLVQAAATLVAQYAANSYSVDISNGDWELESPNTNPDTSAYDGVYRNSRYWNSPPGEYADKLYISVVGYTSFTVYIRSNAEVSYSYTIAVKADYDPTSFNDAINNKQGATSANNTSTAISGYTAVTYTLDGGSHTLCIVYGHKDNIKQNDDRGYLLIPKVQ